MSWYRIKETLNWLVVGIIATSILIWAWQSDQEKETIVIATASKGGYYYEFGRQLQTELKRIGGDKYDIVVKETKGSVNNSELLRKGAVDFGILAIGSVKLQNLTVVAPLWKDYAHVVVRKDQQVSSLKELEGMPFILGRPGSGYRAQANKLMEFFNVDVKDMQGNELYFSELLDNQNLQGSIVTKGLLNPDLRELLFTGQFKLMPVTTTEGFVFNNIFHSQDDIPAGVYQSINGPIPAEAVSTVSTMAVLAASRHVHDDKVELILEALASSDLRSDAPVLLDINPISHPVLKLLDLHPVSEEFYDPNYGLNVLSRAIATLEDFLGIILFILAIGLTLMFRLSAIKVNKARQAKDILTSELFETYEDLLKLEQIMKEVSDIRLLKQYEYQILTHKKHTIALAKSAGLEKNDIYLSVVNECNELSAQINNRLQIFQQQALENS